MSGQSMPKDDLGLYVNFPVSDSIYKAPSDPESAARVLLLAAKMMRARQPLPYQLANYLADAFEAAMPKPENRRADELAFELNLRARNKRPAKFDWIDAYRLVQKNPGLSRPKLVVLLMKEGNCSESHARRLLKLVEQADEEYVRICRENGESDDESD